MDRVHDSVAWYQKKIGSYDRQLWEQSVESKILQGIHSAPRRVVRIKTELIDVDLVRGSTFSKAKPQVSWTYIAHKAICRVVFFPLFYRWWWQQVTLKFWFFLLFLYISQVVTLVVYARDVGDRFTKDELSLTLVVIPCVLMLLLGMVHSHTVASHISHRAPHREGKHSREGKSRRRNPFRNSMSKNIVSSSASTVDSSVKEENITMVTNISNGNVAGLECGSEISKNVDQVNSTTQINNSVKDKSTENVRVSSTTQISNGVKDNCTENVKVNSMESTKFKKSVLEGKSVSWSQIDSSHVHGKSSLESNSHVTGKSILGSHKATDSTRLCEKSTSDKVSSDHESDHMIGNGGSENLVYIDGQKSSDNDTSSNSCKFEILNMDKIELEKSSDDNIVSKEKKMSDSDSQILKPNDVVDCNTKNSQEEESIRSSKLIKNSSSSDFKPDISDTEADKLQDSSQNLVNMRGFSKGVQKESESDSERGESDSEAITFQGLRRRKPRVDDSSESGASYCRPRRLPSGSVNRKDTKGNKKERELSPSVEKDENKGTVSSEEWEDRVHSDVTTSTYSTSSSDSDMSENDIHTGTSEEQILASALNTNSAANTGEDRNTMNQHVINLLQPPTSCTSSIGHHPPPDKVSCLIWESSEVKKVELTGIDIGWTIIEKVDNIPESSDYILIGLVFSIILGLMPVVFQIYNTKNLTLITSVADLVSFWKNLNLSSWRFDVVLANGILQRFCLSSIFFFLLSVADRTFKQRLLYAKHFCYLTSSRRARKFDMPHFRLNKVRNIKTWLSLRSYLKKRGPQRSVDMIVSASFLTSIILLTLMCLQLLKDADTYLDFLCNWELLGWCMALGIYLMRFMTLGLKINKKYRNLSVLITEQINLYLQMEQKPHKKEELMVANNVLKLAEDLLKELESPFKISGVSANPVIYNIIKVVVLSAFSAVLTEILGFKLKLYKIKLKA